MKLPSQAVLLDRRRFFMQRSEALGSWRYPQHGHSDFSELFYVVRGALTHTIGERSDRLAAGALVLVREQDQHALAGSNLEFINLNLRSSELVRAAAFLGDGARLNEMLASGQPPAPIEVPPAERAAVLEDCNLLMRSRDHAGEHRVFERLLISWLHRFLEDAAIGSDGRPRWLDPALGDAAGALAVATPARIARHAGVSQAHLSRTMQRIHGCGPAAWLNRLRLERAALRLAHSEDAIRDIASDLGFRQLTWFYRLFSRTYGVTPADYRRRYGGHG